MNHLVGVTPAKQHRMLAMSTFSFGVCFAVWTIFSIIGVKIKQNLGLNDTQFANLSEVQLDGGLRQERRLT
jgi:NNP family nitrate/nitrite transporter-like MFS transporter